MSQAAWGEYVDDTECVSAFQRVIESAGFHYHNYHLYKTNCYQNNIECVLLFERPRKAMDLIILTAVT